MSGYDGAKITAPDGRVLFTKSELRCRGSGLLILAPGFADQLLKLRLEFGRPMILNSVCRSEDHNRSVGGHPRSLHVCDFPHWPTGGCAAIDVSTHQWVEARQEWVERETGVRDRLESVAWDLGWSVGYGRTFLHLDRRTDYLPEDEPRRRQIRFDY